MSKYRAIFGRAVQRSYKSPEQPMTHLLVIKKYLILMRFHKPVGTLLLLWPTLWALWLAAHGMPSLKILFVFVMGVILMRAAGCVVNDFADRHIDGYVKRTAQRPLPMGLVTPKEAVVLFFLLSTSAFLLVLLTNRLTIELSFVALALAIIYPFMKRYTHWPQLILGLAFSWGIPMAFAAVTGSVPIKAWILFAAATLWTVAYDTEYAVVDYEDDLKIGIKSTAVLFGPHCIWIISLIQMIVIGLLILIGYSGHFTAVYFLGVALAAVLAIYQQRLIRYREPTQCFNAFLNNNWFGLAIFLGILLMRQ